MDSAPKLGRWRVGSLSIGAVRRLPLALIILLAIGIELRIAIWVAWDPVVANVSDELRYVIQAREGVFIDPGAPGGYAMLLRALHFVASEVELVVLVQHLLGIATALLLYGAVRRVGAPLCAAALTAGAVLLSGDQVFLEHALLTESTFGFLLAVSVYAAVRALEPSAEPRLWRLTASDLWIALAGLALGLAVWVRAPAIALIPLLALWFAWASGGSRVQRLSRAALAGGVGVAAVLVYFSLNALSGPNFGLTQDGASGWTLYSRVGQFADCERFDPPDGTEFLCQSSDPDSRPGPDFYGWEPGSPAVREFQHSPIGGDRLGEFASAAIRAQPGDYLAAVANDSVRYFLPSVTDNRVLSGTNYDYIDAGYRPPDVEDIHAQIQTYYPGEQLDVETGVADTLSDVQNILRVHPALMLVALILGVAGAVVGAGNPRRLIVLLLAFALTTLVFPAAVAIYSARYTVPVAGLFVAAGAIGTWLIIGRIRSPREATP
jgi:Dolichyl-phosphate-mannose-protein mannosyltransferase